MNGAADLSNLRDLALPPEVSLWPPAPGWWILAIALLVTAVLLAGMLLAHHRRNAYRRAALRALATVDPSGISAVLKRAALAAWPRERVALLTGEAWLAFLDASGHTTAFTAGPGRDLEALTFARAADPAAAEAVRREARRWVRHHRRGRLDRC